MKPACKKAVTWLIVLPGLSLNSYILSAQNWAYIPGITAQDIAVGKNGSVWATGTNSTIYRRNGSSWETMPGGAERIAVDPEGAAWVIGSGYIFKYNQAANNWDPKPGMAKDIGIGADGSVWVIGANTVQGGYDIYKWNGSNWNKIPGGALRIAVDPSGNPWVINSTNNILRYNGSVWETKPGAARDIGIGANGAIWITGLDYKIYQWNGSNWKVQTGGAEQISVAPDGNAWVANNGGHVFQTTNAVPEYVQIRTLYPRGGEYEFRALKALRVVGFESMLGAGGTNPTYASLSPLYQALGRLALTALEINAMRFTRATAENIFPDIYNFPEVRKRISGILAVLVMAELVKNTNDAPTIALKNWAAGLYRSVKVRSAYAVLKEYQKWKGNPCMYDDPEYKKPVDCGLGHINVAALISSYSPPQDLISKAGLKTVLGNNADAVGSGIALGLASVAGVASYLAVVSGLGLVIHSTAVSTTGAAITLTYSALYSAFGGSYSAASSAALGATGWTGVVAAPVAAVVLAIVVGTTEGFRVVEASKVEPMLKMKVGAAMSEHINIHNVITDTSSAQMFLVAFMESAEKGFVITPPNINGEVRFYNQGGYVAQFRLSYTLNGQHQDFTTPDLAVGQERIYSIPYNATNINLKGWYLGGVWKEIFNHNLEAPTYLCVTSFGTVFAPSAKKDCPEMGNMTTKANQLTVTQGGGYSAWIRLSWEENGSTVTKIDGERGLGWRYIWDVPANAKNIRLVVWSATGWVGSPWKEIVNRYWPTPPNECIKVYGTSLDPKANAECN